MHQAQQDSSAVKKRNAGRLIILFFGTILILTFFSIPSTTSPFRE